MTIGDFTHLPTHCKFLALMPQWDFLNFLVEHRKALSRISSSECKPKRPI